MFKSLILIGLVFATIGCGKTSKIKTNIEARAIGDGEHITFKVVVPLSEKAISEFESPVKDLDPMIRGIVGSVMNIGATMGAGKQRLSLTQPIPKISDTHLGPLKIKRIFFYLEDPEKDQEKKEGKPTFDFLRKLVVKMSSAKMARDEDSWEPEIQTGSMDKRDLNFFESLFKSKRDRHAQNWDNDTSGLLMIRYEEEKPEKSVQSNKFGPIHIIKTKTPNLTRQYLQDHYGKYFERIHTLSKSILVELKKDPILEEEFKIKIDEDSQVRDELGIWEINQCKINVCLDLKVPDVNLLPIIMKGNAIRIDTYIDPKKAPKSFQLKGFIELEVKIKSKL